MDTDKNNFVEAKNEQAHHSRKRIKAKRHNARGKNDVDTKASYKSFTVEHLDPSTILIFDMMNFLERFSLMTQRWVSKKPNYIPLSNYPNLSKMKGKVDEFCKVITNLGVPESNIIFIFDGVRDSKAEKVKEERQIKRFNSNSTNVYPNASTLLYDYLRKYSSKFHVHFTSKSDADDTIKRLITHANKSTPPNEKQRILLFSADRGFEQSVCQNVILICKTEYTKLHNGKSKYRPKYTLSFTVNENLKQPSLFNESTELATPKFKEEIIHFLSENSFSWQELYQRKLLNEGQKLGYSITPVWIKKGNPLRHLIKFFSHILCQMCRDSGSKMHNSSLIFMEYDGYECYFEELVLESKYIKTVENFMTDFINYFNNQNLEIRITDIVYEILRINYGYDCFNKCFPSFVSKGSYLIDISEINYIMFELAELVCLKYKNLIYAEVAEYIFSLSL